MNIVKRVVDFVFPFLCPVCYQIGSTEGFCSSCWKQLDFIGPPYCSLCGDPFSMSSLSLCYQCRSWLPLFASHRSLWRYGPISRRVIFSLKHGRQRCLAPLLAMWLLPLALPFKVDYILPVPLHPSRLARRGFNQSALIAQAISGFTGIPLLLERLKRVAKTPSQGQFSPRRRQENVDGAFECIQGFQGESLLLIDDVYTTGATLNACVTALHKAGAHNIHALTLAKVVMG